MEFEGLALQWPAATKKEALEVGIPSTLTVFTDELGACTLSVSSLPQNHSCNPTPVTHRESQVLVKFISKS